LARSLPEAEKRRIAECLPCLGYDIKPEQSRDDAELTRFLVIWMVDTVEPEVLISRPHTVAEGFLQACISAEHHQTREAVKPAERKPATQAKGRR
jgi:hypothetical protein